MKILHVGLGQCSNIGDQAITDCIEKIFDDQTVDYKFTRLNYYSSAVNNNVSESRSVTKSSVKSKLRAVKWLKALYEFVLPLLKWKYYWELYGKAKSSDKVLIGGGNILMDVDLLFPWHLLIITKVCRLAGSEPVLFLAGVGPLRTRLGRVFASSMSFMLAEAIVRDAKSKELLHGLNESLTVKVLPDPVFFADGLLSVSRREREIKGPFCVLVSVFPYGSSRVSSKGSSEDEKAYFELVLHLLAEIRKKVGDDIVVDFLVTDKERDFELAADFRRVLGCGEILVPNTSKGLLQTIRDYDFVLASRMHAAISAACMRVPFMALSWQDKFEGCFEVVGLNERVYSISRFERWCEVVDYESLLEQPRLNTMCNEFRCDVLGVIK